MRWARDDFASSGAQQLLARARREGDRRVLRFLGEEDKGALQQMEAAWTQMTKAEALQRQRRRQPTKDDRTGTKAAL